MVNLIDQSNKAIEQVRMANIKWLVLLLINLVLMSNAIAKLKLELIEKIYLDNNKITDAEF